MDPTSMQGGGAGFYLGEHQGGLQLHSLHPIIPLSLPQLLSVGKLPWGEQCRSFCASLLVLWEGQKHLRTLLGTVSLHRGQERRTTPLIDSGGEI